MIERMENPYVGPRTFEEQERDRFFGREREARELLALTISEQLVLFYAQSGAGKSSLINTCLIPDLKQKGFKIFPVARVGGDAPAGLRVDNIYVFNLIRTLATSETNQAALAGLSLGQFLANQKNESQAEPMRGEEEDNQEKHLLIMDQFEELFTTHHEEWEKREDFFNQLAHAMQADPYLWVLLVMREDYIAALDPYVPLLPGRARIRYYMQRLGRKAALQAVKTPAEKLRPYAPGVAEKLVDDLCGIKVLKPDGSREVQPGQYVEPVQLQVVCYELWQNPSLEGKQIITEHELREVGEVNTVLGDYYARRVKEVAAAKKVKERKIREWIQENLITSDGIRKPVLQERHTSSGGLDDDVIQALQSDLIRAEMRSGGTWYELTHDRLVEPIIANNRTWLNENLSPLQRQADLWDDQERNESWLLSDQALAEVEQWATDHPDEMTEIENEFLDACRKLQAQVDQRRASERRELEMTQKLARSVKTARLISIVAASFAVAAFIIGAIAFDQANRARASETVAQDLADTARARELASESDKAIGESLDLSMLLSAEAYNAKKDNRNAQNVLFNNGQDSARLRGFLADSINPADEFMFSPDGKFLVALKKDGKYKNLVLWNLAEDLKKGRLLDNSRVNPYYFFSPDSKFLFYLNQEGINIWNLEKSQKEGEPLNSHQGEVTQVIFNPDGNTYATLGENGNVILWDTATSKPDLPSFRGEITVFSPDGRKFAVFELDKITVNNIPIQEKDQLIIDRDPYSVTSMAFNQDGSLLAIADRDGIVDFWKLGDVNEQGIAFSVPEFPLYGIIEKMAFHPNGNLVILLSPRLSSDGRLLPAEVRILDGETGKQGVDPSTGNKIVISPDGSSFVAQDENSNLRIYDAGTNDVNNENTSVKGTLAEFSWDASTLAIFNREDNKLSLVNSSNGEEIGDLSTQAPDSTGPVTRMAFSSNDALLGVGFENGRIEIWDVNRLTPAKNPDLSFAGAVTSLAFSPDAQQLIAGRIDGTISIWNLNSNRLESMETNFPGKIESMSLSPDENFLYSITDDNVALVDAETLKTIDILPGNRPQFAADNERLVVLNEKDGSITFWDTSDRKLIAKGIKADATGMSFSPKWKVLRTSDADSKNTLWNLNGDELVEFQGELIYSPNEEFVIIPENNLIRDFIEVSTGDSRQQPVGQTYIAFSPKDNILLTLSAPGQFEMWDTSDGEARGKPVKANRFIAFSPDEKILFTSGVSGKLDLWDTATGDSLGKLDGDAVIRSNRDGTRLIIYSGAMNANSLWNMTSLKKIADLPGNFNQISPDGQIIVMSHSYGVSLWDFKSGGLIGEPIAGESPAAYFSSDGNVMAIRSYSYDYNYGYRLNVRIWDIAKRMPVGEPIQGDYRGLSSDGKILATGTSSSGGDLITLWDTTSGKQLGSSFRGIPGQVGNIWFNPNFSLKLTNVQGGAFVVSSAGETLANFSPNGGLTLWDISTPSMPDDSVRQFPESITNSLLSPDGDTLVVSSKEGIAFWNTLDGSSIPDVRSNHIREASEIYLNPDHNTGTLIAKDKDGNLSVWVIAAPEKPIITLTHESFCGFSPDGRIFVTAAFSSITRYSSPCDANYYPPVVIYVFRNAATGSQIGERLIGSYSSNTIYRQAYSFTQDGRFLMIQPYGESGLKILEIAGDAENIRLNQVGGTIPGSFQRFTPDGRFVIARDDNNEYELWETEAKERTGEVIETFTGSFLWTVTSDNQRAIFYTSTYNPNSQTSLFNFDIWDLSELQSITKIENLTEFPVISPSGTFMAGANDEGQYMVWSLTEESSESIEGKPLGFSPDNRYLVVLDETGETPLTTILSLPRGKEVLDIGPFPGAYWGFGGLDNQVVIFNDDKAGGFILYKLENGERINKEPIPVDNLILSPEKEFLASFYRGEVSVWNTLTAGDEVPIFTVSFDKLIGFSADEETFITIEDKEGISEISLLDTNTGDPRGKPFRYPGSLTGNRISADRKRFSVFGNGGIFSWDLTRPDAPPTSMVDPTGEVNRMAFSPIDDRILATVGDDGVYLWDISKPVEPISPLLKGSTGRILDIGFSADGNKVVYLNSDGIVFEMEIAAATQSPDRDIQNVATAIPPPEHEIHNVENACRMALSPHGESLAYIRGKKLHVERVADKQEILEQNDDQNVSCDGPLAFSENGSSFVYSEGNRIYVYTRLENGNFAKKPVIIGESSKFTDLTFVLGDQILVVTGDDGRIFFWDLDERALLGVFHQPGIAKRFTNGRLQIYLPSEWRLIKVDFADDKWQELLNKWETDICLKVGRPLEEDEWQQVSTELYPPNPSCPMPPPENNQ